MIRENAAVQRRQNAVVTTGCTITSSSFIILGQGPNFVCPSRHASVWNLCAAMWWIVAVSVLLLLGVYLLLTPPQDDTDFDEPLPMAVPLKAAEAPAASAVVVAAAPKVRWCPTSCLRRPPAPNTTLFDRFSRRTSAGCSSGPHFYLLWLADGHGRGLRQGARHRGFVARL